MIKKIFWGVLIFTLLVWVGVGIYFLRPVAPPKMAETPTALPKLSSVSRESTEANFLAQVQPDFFGVSGIIKNIDDTTISLQREEGTTETYGFFDKVTISGFNSETRSQYSLEDLKQGMLVEIVVRRQDNGSYLVERIRVTNQQPSP